MSPNPLPIVCAWCDRVRTMQGRWEIPGAEPGPAPATHGICPDCLAAQEREAGTAVACRF